MNNKYLISQASDRHKLKKEKSKIILGGYSFNSNFKIIAHSDGDLILHAISNGILGLIQMGDIGQYFADTKIENKNISSKEIVNFCLKHLKQNKIKIINIDITITCENIMINEHKNNIIKSLQKILKIKLINIKATRFETKNDFIKCDLIMLGEKQWFKRKY